jgi:hypothetical protein
MRIDEVIQLTAENIVQFNVPLETDSEELKGRHYSVLVILKRKTDQFQKGTEYEIHNDAIKEPELMANAKLVR